MDRTNGQIAAIRRIAEQINKTAPRKVADAALLEINHNATAALSANAERIASRLEALVQVINTKSPNETDLAHEKRSKEAVATMRAYTEERKRINHDIARQQLDSLDRMIADKVKLVPDEFAPEVRAHLRTLNAQERHALVKTLIDENEASVLGAILKAPAVLAGITKEEQVAYTQAFHEKHAAAELATKEGILEALDGADSAIGAAGVAIAALDKPTQVDDPARLDSLRSSIAAADAAREAFAAY